MPVLPTYRNQSIDLLANQLTGFYMRATLALNGLIYASLDHHEVSIGRQKLKATLFYTHQDIVPHRRNIFRRIIKLSKIFQG